MESDGGLYLVGTPLTLAPGTAQTVNLAVSRQPVPSYDKKDIDATGEFKLWDNPLMATLVIVGMVGIIGLLLGDSDPQQQVVTCRQSTMVLQSEKDTVSACVVTALFHAGDGQIMGLLSRPQRLLGDGCRYGPG